MRKAIALAALAPMQRNRCYSNRAIREEEARRRRAIHFAYLRHSLFRGCVFPRALRLVWGGLARGWGNFGDPAGPNLYIQGANSGRHANSTLFRIFIFSRSRFSLWGKAGGKKGVWDRCCGGGLGGDAFVSVLEFFFAGKSCGRERSGKNAAGESWGRGGGVSFFIFFFLFLWEEAGGKAGLGQMLRGVF